MARLQSILVVGGGAAGWLVACYLAKHLNAAAPGSIRVALVEAPGIGLLGVGEATFPSIRGTLSAIGLEEGRLLSGANATFKQGIRYDHWVRPPGSAGPASFFHPFSLPSQRPGCPELLPYWLLGGAAGGMQLAQAVTMQYRLVAQGHGPKRASDPDYQGPMNYAYHFDAARVAAVLAEHGQQLGVTRHEATVERVELDERGAIASLVTPELGELKADLYVDCTGLRSRLIGGAMQSPFRSRTDVLFVDRTHQVVGARETMPPNRPFAGVAPWRGHYVIEMPAGVMTSSASELGASLASALAIFSEKLSLRRLPAIVTML